MSLCLLIIVFMGCLVLGFAGQTQWNEKNYSLYCIFGLLLIVAATVRPQFMPDYHEYEEAILGNNNAERMEISFQCIRWFNNLIGINPLGTFLTYAILGTTIVMYCIKRDSQFYWFSLMLFISLYFILGEMIQMRQAVAIALLLLSVKYIYLRNAKKYFLISIIAILFHYSAIIMLCLYPLSTSLDNQKRYIYALLISFVLGNLINYDYIVQVVNIEIVTQLYYIKTAPIENIPSKLILNDYRFIIQLLICIFLWVKGELLQTISDFSIIYLKLFTIGLCIYMLFFNIIDLAVRLSNMFLISEVILLPIAIKIVKPRWCGKLAVSVIGFKYFISSLTSYLI